MLKWLVNIIVYNFNFYLYLKKKIFKKKLNIFNGYFDLYVEDCLVLSIIYLLNF